jgi:hypothetical protein
MKYRWLSAIFIALVAVAAGCIAYHFMRQPAACDCLPGEAGGMPDDLAWIRMEFKLAPSQLRQIEAVHGAYQSVCQRHCDEIAEARTTLAAAREQKRAPGEIAAAESRLGELDEVCKAGTTAYVREIAGIIGGEEGGRYLAIVLPRVARFDHSAAATPGMHGAPGLPTTHSCPTPPTHTHGRPAGN